MRLGFRSMVGVLASLVLTAASGCDDDGGPNPNPVHVFTGQVNAELFVAMVSDDDNVVLYACDGTADAVTLAEWFQGPHDGGHFELTSIDGDATVTGDVDGSTSSGTIESGDTVMSFTLAPVQGEEAGLYFDKVHTAEIHQWGGWIVRDDGSIRGSVINRTTGGIVAAGDATPGQEVTVDSVEFDVALLESADPL